VRDARFVGSTALVCLFVRVNYTVNDLDTEVSERNSGLSFSSTKFLTTNNTHFLDGSLYCANAGDSEAILIRGRTPLVLSTLHRPHLEAERMRITNAGGFIARNRVNNILAVTRSFGDWIFENLVISMPAHHSTQLKPEDSFLILASDGLWDSLTYQEATDLVLEVTESVNNEVITAQKVSELLANAAIKKSHSDNVTVIVVKLK